jgi:hypothetical protein
MGGQRGLLGIIAGIVVLLVATVVVVLVAGSRPPREYPVGSPEAALQRYLVAWEARDIETAYASFSSQVQTSTSLDEYRRRAIEYRSYASGPEGPSRRVFIDRATITGDRASLELTIEETWVSGLNANHNRYPRLVSMVRESGAWRFDELLVGLEMTGPEKPEPAVKEIP